MSGFFAVLSRSKAPVDPDLLKRMEASLAHRGGDASGCAVYGRCGLGQISRWTTPEQVGTQPPFQLEEAGLSLVGDVRLDNREELLAALALGHSGTIADEDLVLRAFAQWGEACMDRLLGDFAFAIWDKRAQRMFVGRDHFGMRPVYYAETARSVLIATQPRALFQDPTLTRQIDDLAVASHLSGWCADKDRTIHHGVLRLPPGSWMRVEERSLRVHTYWAFDPERQERLPNNRAYTERFREIFTDAVRVRLRTRGPAGLMLSGGLDSSGVLGVMRQLRPEGTIPCYTARFPDFPGVDEGPYLELLQAEGQVEMHEEAVDRITPASGIEDAMAYYDEPLYGGNSFVYAALARRAASDGVGSVLDGLDGDSAVDHGWQYPNVLWHKGRVRRAWREIRAMQRRESIPLRVLLSRRLFGIERELFQQLYGIHAPWGYRRRPPGLMSRDLCKRSGWLDYARAYALRHARPATELSHVQIRHLGSALLTLFNESTDHVAQALGVDHRHPYFDKRLLEFCLALPGEQRLSDGWDRVVQRRAFEGLVPKEIQHRQSKSVWSQVFVRQLRAEAKDLGVLANDPRLLPYVDVPAMKRAIHALETEGEVNSVELWLAGSFARWLVRQT